MKDEIDVADGVNEALGDVAPHINRELTDRADVVAVIQERDVIVTPTQRYTILKDRHGKFPESVDGDGLDGRVEKSLQTKGHCLLLLVRP